MREVECPNAMKGSVFAVENVEAVVVVGGMVALILRRANLGYVVFARVQPAHSRAVFRPIARVPNL